MLKILNNSVVSPLLLKTLVRNYGELVYTNSMSETSQHPKIKTYRAMDLDGKITDNKVKYDPEFLNKILKTMIYVDEMDTILLKVKAQGKISFYMSSAGEGACIIGSAAALEPEDWIYTQYREQGAFIWRGYTIDQIMNQLIGNVKDAGKGRQMPIHFGSKALNMVTLSSPLTTQVPQAAGTGYAFRTAKLDKISAVYLGQGAASEGDFPTALNFAATLKCQTLFFCRNNKYAISTPTGDQYASDGIIPRAIAMGIASIRVDGNDTLACLQASRYARKYIIENRKPFFLQFMTYRMGDHSTSDNSTLYRKQDERKEWREKNNPIQRLKKFLKGINFKDTIEEDSERIKVRKDIVDALRRSQKHKFPTVQSLFEDVYDKLPRNLQEQKEELLAHLKQYKDKYPFLQKLQK